MNNERTEILQFANGSDLANLNYSEEATKRRVACGFHPCPGLAPTPSIIYYLPVLINVVVNENSTADLHLSDNWFRWLLEKWREYDLVCIAGDHLDLFNQLPKIAQAREVQN